MAPESRSIYARTLERVALVMGDVHSLARRLEVSVEDLERWMRGEEPPPERVFEDCVEILLLVPGP